MSLNRLQLARDCDKIAETSARRSVYISQSNLCLAIVFVQEDLINARSSSLTPVSPLLVTNLIKLQSAIVARNNIATWMFVVMGSALLDKGEVVEGERGRGCGL